MKIWLFLGVLLYISICLEAQINPNDQLKSKIEILFKNNEIDSINDILNKDNSLEPEFVFEKLNRNIEKSKSDKNIATEAKTYLILGNFWHKQANKLKAFENYLQAETIARNINDKKLLATCLMNKSTLLEDKQERIKTLSEASEIFSKEKDTLNLMKSFLNTGIAYSQLYEESNDSIYSQQEILEFKRLGYQHYAKAEILNKSYQNDELAGVLNIYYGEWYKHEKQFDKAIESFNKASEILATSKNIKAQTYCVFMLARIAVERNNYKQAIKLLKESEEQSKQYKFNDYLARIYEEYVKIYTQMGDYKKALEYSELFTKKSIELTEQSNNDKMQILSLEKNIAENKLQINKYEFNSKINRILIFSSLIIALFIGGISYLIIKNNRRKIDSIEKNNIITEVKLKNQQLEDELLKEKVKFNQEHLISFANQVSKIEFFLDEMKTKFKKIPGSQEEINQLKLSFSELLNGQSQLKQINSLSSELNHDFFFHIKQNFPNISKGEEKLLAYIILNIGSKEISRILNISEKSIYIKRYRLRKKLNLGSEETFEDFYIKVISSLN